MALSTTMRPAEHTITRPAPELKWKRLLRKGFGGLGMVAYDKTLVFSVRTFLRTYDTTRSHICSIISVPRGRRSLDPKPAAQLPKARNPAGSSAAIHIDVGPSKVHTYNLR